MMVWKTGKRLFSLLLIVALVLGLATTALAAPVDVIDAKDEIAKVEITQKYNGKTVDSATHNYATAGDTVNISYEATLQMTEEMAVYLKARQAQLMDAKFNVCIKMDMEVLEFQSDPVEIYFSSTFLKPQNSSTFTSELVSSEGGVFTYKLTVSKEAAENPENWMHNSTWSEDTYAFVIPMELIVYADGNRAYGFDEVPDGAANQQQMYAGFSEKDWMHEIKISLASMKVKDGVAETVTADSSTWKTVCASGTVDGEFTYERWTPITCIGDFAKTSDASRNTLEFGNENTIEEWTSNEVQVKLVRLSGGIGSPWLNMEDHFAYIIGYPDNTVRPDGNITRAEVATIFFRMLNDETRDTYWSKTNNYNDVKSTDWYNNAISTLTKLGVLTGYPDGGFHPQANITRAEFATMAVRFFDVTGVSTSGKDAFSDIDGHWANEYINMAYLLEIVNGYPDGTYRPQKAITRAEAMTIVNNTLRRSPCNEGIRPVAKDMITWPDNMDTTKWYYAAVQEATNSHEYTYFAASVGNTSNELWQKILPVRDWAAFEKAWSDANSASNPGEVVDSN